jgi:hypothetical protein
VRRDNARGFDPAGFPDWPLTQRFPIGGFAFLLPLFLLPAKRFPDFPLRRLRGILIFQALQK